MTDTPTRAAVLAALIDLAGDASLSPKARAQAEGLREALERPVGIALLGPGRAALSALWADLIGPDAGLDLPTAPICHLFHATRPRTRIAGAEGHAGALDGLVASQSAAGTLRYGSPQIPADRDFLLLSPASEAEWPQALAWVGPRETLLLWSGRDWSDDAALWQSDGAPFAAQTIHVSAGDRAPAAAGFLARLSKPSPADLLSTLDQYVAEAQEQGLYQAMRFLNARRPDWQAQAASTVQPRDTRPVTRSTAPNAESRAEVARLFHALRDGARAIWMTLQGAEASTSAALDEIETLFASIAERATRMGALIDRAPEVPALLAEAHDMAILLRAEGGEEGLRDGARLLCQVRDELAGKVIP